GVWVIAETTELPTRYAKIVVTDDQGRYLLPEAPHPVRASPDPDDDCDRSARCAARIQIVRRLDRSDRRRSFAQPPRPQGIERNVVLTLVSGGGRLAISTTRTGGTGARPTVNPNGKLYGTTEDSTDFIPILDPVRNTAVEVKHPVRDPKTPSSKD